MPQIRSIIIITIVVLLLDTLWLGYIGRTLYLNALSELMRSDDGQIKVNYIAAAMTYTVLILGITFFVLPLAKGNILAALLWGGFFGFVCYGIYDFTNMAILPKWPLAISIIDIIWGCILSGVASATAVWFNNVL